MSKNRSYFIAKHSNYFTHRTVGLILRKESGLRMKLCGLDVNYYYYYYLIKHSRYLLFADDIKIYRAVSSIEDCNLLQSDIDSVRGWYASNYMKLNVDKTKVITFCKKTSNLMYGYKLFHSIIPRTHSVKGLGVDLDSILQFHENVNFIFSHWIKMLGLIRSVTFNYSTIGSILISCFALVKSNVEYTSVVWNAITSTDANKLERIRQKFTSLCSVSNYCPSVRHTSAANIICRKVDVYGQNLCRWNIFYTELLNYY
jgi:hypothetical protein